MVLTVFIAVIAHRAVVLLPHGGNEGAPLRFPVLGHGHFAAGQEQPTAFGLGKSRVVGLEGGVVGKPSVPLGLAGHIVVKKADARPPHAIGTVDGRLQRHLQAQLLGKADGTAQLLVCGGGIGAPVDLFTVRVRLYSRGRQDDPVCPGLFCHIRQTAAGSIAGKHSPVGKGRKIDTVKVVFQLHDIFLVFSKINVRLHNQYNDFLAGSSICPAIFSGWYKRAFQVLVNLTEKSGQNKLKQNLK